MIYDTNILLNTQLCEGRLIQTVLQRLGVLTSSFTVNTINLWCAYYQIVVYLNTDAWPPYKNAASCRHSPDKAPLSISIQCYTVRLFS